MACVQLRVQPGGEGEAGARRAALLEHPGQAAVRHQGTAARSHLQVSPTFSLPGPWCNALASPTGQSSLTYRSALNPLSLVLGVMFLPHLQVSP